jgi:hypothetical protein
MKFFHRANPDGSFDSICYRCLVIVAARKKELDLEHFERGHACEPNLLKVNSSPKEANADD